MNKREKLRSLKVGEVFLPPEKDKKKWSATIGQMNLSGDEKFVSVPAYKRVK